MPNEMQAPAPESRPSRRRRIVAPIQVFLRTEAAGGAVLLAAALVAIVAANSPWAAGYDDLLATPLPLRLGPVAVDLDLHGWVNEALMALFFLVVGVEIKRELLHGELRDRRAAAVPAIAALGGMVGPALVYLALTAGTAAARGWGIPMATDIAFAVGVLALVGRGAPPGLRAFLLTLAIVDDIAAIAVIAVVYSGSVGWGALALAGALCLGIAALRGIDRCPGPVFAVLGLTVWYVTYRSGVHATVAGVVLGLLAPVPHPDADARSGLERLEERLHPWTSFAVLPVFALANAGVHLSSSALTGAAGGRVASAVAVAQVVGKFAGIGLATWLAVRSGVGRLPDGVTRRGVLGVAAVAGVGFTVALFVARLAFPSGPEADGARVGILVGSALAGALGFGILRGRRA